MSHRRAVVFEALYANRYNLLLFSLREGKVIEKNKFVVKKEKNTGSHMYYVTNPPQKKNAAPLRRLLNLQGTSEGA